MRARPTIAVAIHPNRPLSTAFLLVGRVDIGGFVSGGAVEYGIPK
jgi:hypothetical protein